MKRVFIVIGLVICGSVSAIAQPRPVDKNASPAATTPAPPSFEARYEGGMFGYNQKENGTLRFDDINERIVFFGKDQKEKFSISYAAMVVVSPSSQSVTSTTGNVVQHIPLPGSMLGGFIKEKRRYLAVQFDDPDVDVRGSASFRIDNKGVLDSVVRTLGEKAKLTPRGEAYYRPRTKPVI